MKEMKPVRYHIGDIPETSKQTAPGHDDRAVGVDDDCFHDSFGQYRYVFCLGVRQRQPQPCQFL
ncbi:TPA: hypothetical protein WM899_000809 [Neisseria gonorrhoeae]|uniref:hypothetical protein n=1 Tax=Neisseria gonorrhoeae TaxID=485 RepID=UPI000ACE3EDF|nr:hypothetical protein [Neisseria gonorrhoeae]